MKIAFTPLQHLARLQCVGGARKSGLTKRTRQLAEMAAVLNFSSAALLHLGWLMIYLMLRWTKKHNSQWIWSSLSPWRCCCRDGRSQRISPPWYSTVSTELHTCKHPERTSHHIPTHTRLDAHTPDTSSPVTAWKSMDLRVSKTGMVWERGGEAGKERGGMKRVRTVLFLPLVEESGAGVGALFLLGLLRLQWRVLWNGIVKRLRLWFPQ